VAHQHGPWWLAGYTHMTWTMQCTIRKWLMLVQLSEQLHRWHSNICLLQGHTSHQGLNIMLACNACRGGEGLTLHIASTVSMLLSQPYRQHRAALLQNIHMPSCTVLC
jgi:hypothetical protein